MNWRRSLVLSVAAVVLAGCATIPTGPSVMVLPAPGKSFESFQSDDMACRQWALQQAGVQPSDAVNEKLASGAAIGTLIGAGLGAAIGAASGSAGAGAAIGAGSGLLAGTAVATGPASASGWEIQRRYDMAYQQCMQRETAFRVKCEPRKGLLEYLRRHHRRASVRGHPRHPHPAHIHHRHLLSPTIHKSYEMRHVPVWETGCACAVKAFLMRIAHQNTNTFEHILQVCNSER
jgi:hypothetical protein